MQEIQENGRTGKYDFDRDPKVQEEYEVEKKKKPDIAKKLFHQKDKNGWKNTRVHSVWQPNKFPYAIEDGEDIQHMLIWYNPLLSDWSDLAKIVKVEVPASLQYKRVYFFHNPPALQTVPGVPHMHVFLVN